MGTDAPAAQAGKNQVGELRSIRRCDVGAENPPIFRVEHRNQIKSFRRGKIAHRSAVDYATAKTSDTARFGAFFRNMRDRGVFLPPSQFEAMFVSLAHTEEDVDSVIAAARDSLS